MKNTTADVVIVGAGPGGYVAAERSAQLGLTTVIIDAGPLGGTCLNVGCIPSKALIHAAQVAAELNDTNGLARIGLGGVQPAVVDLAATMAWKDDVVARLRGGVASLLDGAGVTRLQGTATVLDGKTVLVETADGQHTVRARHLVLATGSEPIELRDVPFGGHVLSSTGALSLTSVPNRLVVVGAGYIGLELGIAYRHLGSTVTVVEMSERIIPGFDSALTRPVADRMRRDGIEFAFNTRALGLAPDGGLVVADATGQERTLAANAILVTVGRRALITGSGIAELRLETINGAIKIDDQCRTSMSGVYAIGDLTGEPMLAHRAMAQGQLVAEVIAGMKGSWDARVTPEVCFTNPEIVSVGARPSADSLVGKSAFRINGRALTLSQPDGFVRVVADRSTHLVCGFQAVGQGVSEFAGTFAVALEMGATLEDLKFTMQAHPTLSETICDAAVNALSKVVVTSDSVRLPNPSSTKEILNA